MKICLSMIVKNEAKVIERCLKSVLPFIDCWAIVDTGSTDGTQEIVKKLLGHLPGELNERKWQDFATNRNQALHLAKRFGDYALVIDADEELRVEGVFEILREAGYYLDVIFGNAIYKRVAIVDLVEPWNWKGVLHEVLVHPTFQTTTSLPYASILVHTEGARSSQDQRTKFLKDSEVLLEELLKDPNNARYQFYYAQSLRDAGELKRAAKAYEKRVEMGGWGEERYIAQLERAKLLERLDEPFEGVVGAYLLAYEIRPGRAETMCELARYCRLQEKFELGYMFSWGVGTFAKTDDILFVDQSVYDWRLRDEMAINAYWTGRYAVCEGICASLLGHPRLPEAQRSRIQDNLNFARQHLHEQQLSHTTKSEHDAKEAGIA